MRVLTIIGTRPEAIKMAPLINLMDKSSHFVSKVCVTGQHREMLDQVINLFGIRVDYDLNIMKKNQNLIFLTSAIINSLMPVIEGFKPNIVLVHGDTITTFSAALASYYQKIPVGHVEAGLRTSSIYSPWPEEGNRRLTSAIAAYHFAPTENAKKNLINESIDSKKILVTGNTVIDSLLSISTKIKNDKQLQHKLSNYYSYLDSNKKLILVTVHRRENIGFNIEAICSALITITKKYPKCQIILPLHLNPKVRDPIFKILNKIDNILLIEPQDYLQFVYLMNRSSIILTDSGGIQEEGPTLGKPVLVMRDSTERPEALTSGAIKLVGTESNNISENVLTLLNNQDEYNKMSFANNPYGDGNASQKIINFLKYNV